MISVFTPTHDPTYLADALESLVRQEGAPEWEWVIVPNGDCAIPPDIANDSRVRVIRAPEELHGKGVGALKKFACEQCRGDWFLELDHDDVLAPTALARVRDAADATDAGFIYSDFCEFREDGTSNTYSEQYGWETYPVTFRGKPFSALRSFDTDAASLALIYYAPNHLRAWSRKAYEATGGHDPALPVVDDHDLLCRTYLAGVKFHRIAECLYFYRLRSDGGNTYVRQNAEIQSKQRQVSNRYIYRLIEEWRRRAELPTFDLATPGLDLRRLPLDDNSIGVVRAFDVLSSIPHCRGEGCMHGAAGDAPCTIGVMNEIYRVLVPGGWLLSRTPSTDGRGAFQDPRARSFWNENSFWYYTNRDYAARVPGVNCRFQHNRVWQEFPDEQHRKHDMLCVYADLVALKGQRQAGLVEI